MQENPPFFSIILPTFNRAENIDIAVQSVVKQSFTDWELIIVDDGSTDDTKERISKYTDDKRVKYFHQYNRERSNARNSGIRHSEGKYICFIDSDDEFLENHLSVFYNNIERDKTGLWFTKTYIRDNKGEPLIKIVPPIKSMNIFAFIMHYTFTPINVCMDKAVLEKVNFDEKLSFGEDLDLWLRIAAAGYCINEINEATAIYNSREDMFGTNAGKYLNSYKIIFRKGELKKFLPENKKNMLFSKCYFFLSLNYEKERIFGKMYFSIIKSFILFPKGYNNKTNKILLVLFLYNLPVAGNMIKFIKTKFLS
jgi:glycosyltransferase involved in cell wall biosynthesis